MTRHLPILCAAAMASFLFTACEQRREGGTPSSEAAEGPEAPKLRIAVIPKGTTHEFWKTVHTGARKAGEELDVEIIWKGPLKEDDRDAQISVVENFITQGVDGIVLAPLDNVALRKPVDDAMQNKIPVVIFDSGLEGDNYVSFVATDNLKGGEIAGQHMAGLVGENGKVVLLRYNEGSDSTTQREEGFLAAIRAVPSLTILSDNQYAGVTADSAQRAAENIIARFKNPDGTLQFQGIFCPNESTTFGTLRALEDGGYAGKVRFIGFDTSEKTIEALKKEHLDGLVVQNPYNMGYLGVKTLVQHIQGTQVEKRIDTGATLITSENMSQPENAELLNPPVDQTNKEPHKPHEI